MRSVVFLSRALIVGLCGWIVCLAAGPSSHAASSSTSRVATGASPAATAPAPANNGNSGAPSVVSGPGTGGAPAPAPSPTPPPDAYTPTRHSRTARAQQPQRGAFGVDGLYADAGLEFGNARPTIPGVADEPFLLQTGLNLTIAYRLFAFLWQGTTRVTVSAGLMPDYRFSGQYSQVDPTVGNFRGTRFQLLTPMVMARIEEDWTIKLGIELSGAYNLSRPTFDGNSLDFGSPFGVNLTGLYSLAHIVKVPNLYGGLQFEYTTFGTTEDSALGTESLSSSVKFLEFGIAVSYVF